MKREDKGKVFIIIPLFTHGTLVERITDFSSLVPLEPTGISFPCTVFGTTGKSNKVC
jgi:hypothetical protein